MRIDQAEVGELQSDFRRLITSRILEAGATKNIDDTAKASFLVLIIAVRLR